MDEPKPVQEGQTAPDTAKVDERGIPLNNVYHETMRKLESIERRYSDQISEKDRQIQMLLAERVQAPKVETYTREELVDAYAEAAGDPKVQAQIAEKLVDVKVQEKTTAMEAQQSFLNKQTAFNSRAMAKYPEITDNTSEFYTAVARNLEARVRDGIPNTPSAILDAANDVATEHPELLNRGAGNRVNPRGWSESGSGKPVNTPKPKDELVDPVLFAKYKREYPNMTPEGIAARQADLNKRLVYEKEQ
jgi:hypothetical protein